VDESGMKGLEEERRLAYVGITRARKKLYISHAANRRIYNQWQNSIPSRFIGEIPPEFIDKLSGGVYSSVRPTMQSWKNEVASILQTAVPSSTARFAVGARVFHQKFGYGRVQAAHGNHIEIDFEKAGRKKVLADFIEQA
jgi:DNA helicase-2/ATP-dependent DNA helicase PcrA